MCMTFGFKDKRWVWAGVKSKYRNKVNNKWCGLFQMQTCSSVSWKHSWEIFTPTPESEEAHSGLCGCLTVHVSEQTCLKSIFYKHYCAKLTWSQSVWRNPWQNIVLSKMAEFILKTMREWNQYVKPQKRYICNIVSQYLQKIATHLLLALKNHCNIVSWDPCRFHVPNSIALVPMCMTFRFKDKR